MATYQIGQRVDVFYNPENPSESFLDPGLPRNIYDVLNAVSASIFALLFSAIMLLAMLLLKKISPNLRLKKRAYIE